MKIVISNDGKKRKLYETKCSQCNKKILKRKDQIEKHKNNFCSSDCFSLFKMTGDTLSCGNKKCKNKVYKSKSTTKRSESGDIFCSRSCSNTVNNTRHKSGINHPNYTGGVSTYRKIAIAHYGAKCQNKNCPVESPPETMLDVHHIDEDRSNNLLENLAVLCVYCHAAKHRFTSF